VTHQGKHGTCWFHAVLNGFMITKNGRDLLRFVLNHYIKSTLGLKDVQMFTTTNLTYPTNRNTHFTTGNITAPTKAIQEQINEFYFWKMVNNMLKGKPTTCSIDMVRLIFPNYNNKSGNQPLNALDKIINMSELKYITSFYKASGTRLDSYATLAESKMVVMEFIPETLIRVPLIFKGALIDHAYISIISKGNKLGHSLVGVLVNDIAYIVDSGEGEVFECDWVTNVLNVLKLSHYVWADTIHFDACVYIKDTINVARPPKRKRLPNNNIK
jgi:hypothetical protein